MLGLAAQVWDQVQERDQQWLRELAALAGPQARVALVGGAVRDALLEETPLDLDVVLEGGDVEALAQAFGTPFLFHPHFQNATLTLPDGRHADLVQARSETYPVAGQHPLPRPGTLEDDLWRRDFSVNALALLIWPEVELLDVTGGLPDLRQRMLRPLHAQSLYEDASRLVRGARLAARLKLHPSAELLAQVPAALKVAHRTPRLWAELRLALHEARPGRVAQLLHDWGAGSLWPDFALLLALDAQQDAGQWVTLPPLAAPLYAAALLHSAPDPAALAQRLSLGDKPGALLSRAQSDTFYPAGSAERTLRQLLRPDSYEPLTGKDVLALGVPAGRAVGAALAHLAGLRQQGQLRSAEQERAALRAYLDRLAPDTRMAGDSWPNLTEPSGKSE